MSAGCGIVGAARYVGCAASTIRREALRNPEFADEIRRAQLAAELSPLYSIRQAAARSWRAAAWLLERIDPQRFARQPVNILKPELVSEYLSLMSDILAEEISDPQIRRRIDKRLQDIERQANAEAEAISRSPLYLIGRKKRAERAVAPSTRSKVTPMFSDENVLDEIDESDEQNNR